MLLPLRDDNPHTTTPVVNYALIAACVAVFLWQVGLDDRAEEIAVLAYGLIPGTLFGKVLVAPEVHRLPGVLTIFTSMFLHGGWLHLIGNMWFLWIYGDNVEDILGPFKYLVFYLACGVAAGLTHVLTNPDSRVPTIGASGAIAGVMGAYMVKFPHSRIVTLVPIFFFVTLVEIPAAIMLVYWFVLQVFSGVGAMAYSSVSQGGVAWFAHAGGFLAGMILVSVMRPRPRYRRREDLHW
jgi:membrane associated rhomboid family serine protease